MDSVIHKSYRTIKKKKKFIPVVEDYLYKRTKGVRSYKKYYNKKKNAH